MELSPNIAEWQRLSACIRAFCDHHILTESIQHDLQLVCEEWFINIVNHGYLESGLDVMTAEPITAELRLHEDQEIVVRFTDAAGPFNPLEHHAPDVSLGAEERQIGGLGIYLIKQKMDICSYEWTEGRNRFTLRMKIRRG